MSEISSEDLGHFSGCNCPSCSGGNDNVDPLEGNYQDGFYGGQDGAPTTYGTTQQMVTQLVSGYWQNVGWDAHQWGTATVTYSLSNEFTAAEKSAFTAAFALWSDVADISFSLVASGAQITIVEGDDGGAWSGNTSYNPTTMDMVSNTISIDTDVSGWDDLSTLGKYGFQTILHEIGHSLGLGHQGNYNGNVNYDTQVQYLNDNRQYSIMSYNNANLLGTDHWAQSGVWQYAATPLLYDIAAIQEIYGANTSTRSGNTVYGFNSTAGKSQYDLTVTSAPFAIWDGGGTDTLDLSGYSTNQTITLVEGAFTSAGYMTKNILIAIGAVIENAVGGSGNDSITGNAAANVLTGGLGNDTFYGSTGNDTLDGGGGTDTVNYTYSISDFLGSIVNATTLTLQHIAQNFTQTLTNIETFVFNSVSYTFTQLEALFAPDVITVRAIWSDGAYQFNSAAVETTNIDAATVGYSGMVGNMMTVDRTSNTAITVTINGNNAPPGLRLNGADNAETITVNGTHNNMTTWIYGGDGGDTISISSGVVGTDRLYGEGGDDTLSSGAGNDYLYGGLGNDTLNGEAGDDQLYGGDGTDSLNGGDGNDCLWGDAGIDTLNGGNGFDYLYGGTENDTLNGNAGIDRLYGDAGNDSLNGGSEDDYLYGGDGDDTLNGDAGNDTLYGQAGNNTYNGGDGDDKLYGDIGVDTMNGDAGSDRLYGNAGADTLSGGDGNDYLYGENDNDTLYGGNNDDYLYGGAGTDRLEGGAGIDRLYGGNGSDTLIGGAGNDFLYGEGSADIFGFTDISAPDIIGDFTLSGPTKDSINLTDVLVGFDEGIDNINNFVALVYKHATRADLYVNADGSGSDWVLAAQVLGSDFSATTVNTLVATGQLITDQTLL